MSNSSICKDNSLIDNISDGCDDLANSDMEFSEVDTIAKVSKGKVLNSVKWTAIEKYSSQGIQFIVSVVMARLLTPAEYGIVGIIGVFIGIAQVFINTGLSQALISKKICTEDDYSTANWINIGISLICYLLLFFSAPIISTFYSEPILIPTIRVMSLTFIIGAFSAVARTKLTKQLKFKQISLVTLVTCVFSGFIGIFMAYMGMGVWALVLQSVLAGLLSSICIIFIAKYRFCLIFKKESFKELFGFGSKILGSDVLWVIFNNIYPLIIGKAFNPQSVGYFSRASSYSGLVPNNFCSVLEKVLFPVFAVIQDDNQRLERFYQKSVLITSFLIITGNFILIGLSYPLVLNMLTEKWLPCVPLLQILCLSKLFSHINSINGRLYMAKGFPGIFLRLSFILQPLHLAIIITSLHFGLEGMAWGEVVFSLTSTLTSLFVCKKYIGFNPFKILTPIIPVVVYSGTICVLSMMAFRFLIASTLINLIIAGVVIITMNYLCLRIFSPEIYFELKNIRK